ncbi:carbon-nitrogen hydrolase [Lentinula aciculospora]|uniref:Carbon-nitrogen hydrolase n=1 Tax=Lentinula aciculospora TaxID=153920 RepID=A0A9W8ZWW4_9AGAR|nr:carbon-nitrogen hydrolase [Lentinula aciculospora]
MPVNNLYCWNFEVISAPDFVLWGQVKANALRAKELCSVIEPKSIDLLCFPEMILSGYVFEDSDEILPYLELPKEGPTSQMCASLARRLGCYVLAGYPERLLQIPDLDTDNYTHRCANSAIFYGPNGDFIGNYRKTNLFITDRTWAKAGFGFTSFDLPAPIGKLTLGICMDLNAQPPADWKARGRPYEIAEYAMKENADVVVLLNAWLDSGVRMHYCKNEKELGFIESVDWTTVEFWATRLKPLWVQAEELSSPNKEDDEGENGKRTIVVVCNRTGEEKGKSPMLVTSIRGQTFAGSSAIFSMHRGSGKPRVIGIMSRREDGARTWMIVKDRVSSL